jgi:hypothetical protein
MRTLLGLALGSILSASLVLPALADPPPKYRVFGCALERLKYEPPDYDAIIGDYLVVFGGDYENQVCQELLNNLIPQYDIIAIKPAEMDEPGVTGNRDSRYGLVYHAVRKQGNQ